MASIIEIQNLTKIFGHGKNGRTAIEQLSLDIQEGDIFGFVGPNGAGKTSTIRIMATLLQPTSGDIRVAGFSVRREPRGVRGAIGYMPDFFGVYNDMTVAEYLDFFADCYSLPQLGRARLVDDLLELVDLTHRREDMVESLSRGMKQRLSLARTLIHDPQVLILDEPASGLDPRARVEIRSLMGELAKMGKTIFFSTHILADVAEICTRVGIIEAGRLVASGTMDELHQHLIPIQRIHLTVLSEAQKVKEALEAIPGVTDIEESPFLEGSGRTRLEFNFSGDDPTLSNLLNRLIALGIPVIHFGSDTKNMEEVFMRATKGLVT